MDNLIDLKAYPVSSVLGILLQDKTTKENIIFATDSYQEKGDNYSATSQMTIEAIAGIDPFDLQPRVAKDRTAQAARTKTRAEIFTPSWLCNRMNNDIDEAWFGRRNIFNNEKEKTWDVNAERIVFPEDKTWRDYVMSRRLEICCGEAPFLVSRYDTTTGDIIFPLEQRIGILDRKLRVVNDNTAVEEEWFEWVYRAFQSTYGYEFQGDSLLIGRINLLNTFVDYLENRWKREATSIELRKAANIIAWNIWQMDGLTGTIPFRTKIEHEQI